MVIRDDVRSVSLCKLLHFLQEPSKVLLEASYSVRGKMTIVEYGEEVGISSDIRTGPAENPSKDEMYITCQVPHISAS